MIHPCSSCGSRRIRNDCARCRDRNIAQTLGGEERVRFLEEEARRIARKPVSSLPDPGSDAFTVGLVGCCRSVRSGAMPASKLHRGRLFRQALEYAQSYCQEVFLLSPLHGIVPPEQEIEAYDLMTPQMAHSEHITWGERIVSELIAYFPLMRLDLTFFCGHQYVWPIAMAVEKERQPLPWVFHHPLNGLAFQDRMRWFERRDPSRHEVTHAFS
jgi:hypothetical protein